MTTPDRIAALSQRITAVTGQALSRDEVMTVVGRAFEYGVDLDDDGQLRALLGGMASSVSTVVLPVGSDQQLSPVAPGGALSPGDPPWSQTAPSGATAKAAAVLALLGGIANLVLAAVLVAAGGYVSEQDRPPGWYRATIYVVAAAGFISAGALLAGAVMTLTRKRFGPQIVAVGCALCIATFFVDLAMALSAAGEGGVGVSGSPGRYLSGLIFPALTLVLALLPSTKRWLAGDLAPADGGPALHRGSGVGSTSGARFSSVARTVGVVLLAASLVCAAAVAVNHFARTQSAPAPRPERRQIELPFTFGKFFKNPNGIAVDKTGTVYLGGGYGVLKLAPDAAAPDRLPFPELGESLDLGRFDVSGVAADAGGNVYATYARDNRVRKLTAGASAPVELPFFGLNRPFGVAANAAGDVYVTDSDNDRVLKLPVGTDTPTTLPFSGLKGPDSIAVDAAGNVYVPEGSSGRVLKLAADSGTPTELPFPKSYDQVKVAVDAAGDVYVAEEKSKKVLRLAAGADAPTELPFVDLKGPEALAVDDAGNVYVVDYGASFRVLMLSAE